MTSTRTLLAAFFAAVSLLHSGPAAAQGDYPSRPIRIVVPYPPGGQTDAYARVIAQALHTTWGHPVVVENRAGANGLIGTNFVKQAPPDGYTLLFTANSAHTLGPLLRDPRPFESIADFTPIAIAVTYPMYLLIDQQIPATTLAEFVAYAKSRPSSLNYSSEAPAAADTSRASCSAVPRESARNTSPTKVPRRPRWRSCPGKSRCSATASAIRKRW